MLNLNHVKHAIKEISWGLCSGGGAITELLTLLLYPSLSNKEYSPYSMHPKGFSLHDCCINNDM